MTQRKEGEKWRRKKKKERRDWQPFYSGCVSPALFHTLYPWLSTCHHCNPTTTTVEVPHKDPFCPRHHRSHIFSALILHERLHRENTNKGKTRLGHREGRRMMRSQKKKPAFPDQGIWSCDARSHRVCV